MYSSSEEQDLGVGGQRPSHREHPLLAVRRVPASCLRRLPRTGNRSTALSSINALLRPGRRKVYIRRFFRDRQVGEDRATSVMQTPERASRSAAFSQPTAANLDGPRFQSRRGRLK